MAKGKQKEKVKQVEIKTISGFVDEFEVDDDAYGLIISTEDSGDYLIKLDRRGKELYDYVDEEIQVTGDVFINEKGENIIAVKHFITLDDADYEDEDEMDPDDDWDWDDRYDDDDD